MQALTRSFSTLLLVLLIALVGSAGVVAQGGADGAAAISLTDDAGRDVALPSPPQRIVSVAPSATELAFAAGLGDRVVAVDSFSDHPAPVEELPHVGSYIEPDIESILGADPDVVLGSGVHVVSLVPVLEARDVPVIVLDAADIDGVLANIELLASLGDDPAAALATVDDLRARVMAVEARLDGVEPVRVFYELDPTLFTAGPGTFIDDVMTRAGGTNIATSPEGGYPQLSPEEVIAADPEVILVADEVAGVTPATVAERPGWQVVSAVVEERIVPIDPDIGSRPGPRVVEALETMSAILHP